MQSDITRKNNNDVTILKVSQHTTRLPFNRFVKYAGSDRIKEISTMNFKNTHLA